MNSIKKLLMKIVVNCGQVDLADIIPLSLFSLHFMATAMIRTKTMAKTPQITTR